MSDNKTLLETAIHIVRQKNVAPAERLNAILYMVECGHPKTCLPVFESILKDLNDNADVRSAAALALGKLGGDRALELLKDMAHAEDITVKNYSVQALGLLGREEGVPELLDALHDKNNTVFASAAEALGRIGRPVVPYLINLLDSGDAEDARCIAAWQLGALRYTEPVPNLVQVVRREKNPELVALAIWALGEIGFGPADVMDTLVWASTHDDPAISQRADMALKKIARHIN